MTKQARTRVISTCRTTNGLKKKRSFFVSGRGGGILFVDTRQHIVEAFIFTNMPRRIIYVLIRNSYVPGIPRTFFTKLYETCEIENVVQ